MCTCRNLLTSLSRLPSSVRLSLSSFSPLFLALSHVSRPPPWPMSVVNCRIYRFWIWAPASQGNLSASPRNLALITAIYPSPPSMTSLRIRVIEAPIREFAYLASPRLAEKCWKRWMILFVTSIRENCFPPDHFCALNWRRVWIKIHLRFPFNSSTTGRNVIWIHSPE